MLVISFVKKLFGVHRTRLQLVCNPQVKKYGNE